MSTRSTPSQTLTRLAELVREEAATQPGRIQFIRLSCDPEQAADIKRELPKRLSDIGLDFIDLDVSPKPGEPTLLEVRRNAGWA